MKLEIKENRIIKQYQAQGKLPPLDLQIELSSGDESPVNSEVSEEGVPENELPFVIDDDIVVEIRERRKRRKIDKIRAQLEDEAIRGVLKVTSRYYEPPDRMAAQMASLTSRRQSMQANLAKLLS